jgi:hemerythrin-like domain-containing protein
MMKATTVLRDEHRVIERVIAALERATQRLEQGDAVEARFFIDATEFIKGFADGCHHQKEEGVLFKAMTASGMPTHQGPIAVMLHEHEQGRAYTRGMREAAESLQAGDDSAVSKIIDNARGYTALLREHIMKEDNVLFPMAENVLPADQRKTVEEGFATLRQEESSNGVLDKYLALADKLEREISS